MESLPSNPAWLRILGTLFRLIPVGARGKGRLARLLLPVAVRSRPVLIPNRYGRAMLVPNLLEPIGLHLWADGVYEPEILEFMKRHATPDSTVVDVGANIGAFSVSVACQAKRVIAIEPSPQVLPYLRKNVALNHLSNVEILACAASMPGRDFVPLYLPPESNFGMASSAPQFHSEPIESPARSLDAIIQGSPDVRVSVVKIDTEGYEAHVFLGAEKLLRCSDPPAVVFEFCDWAEERAFPGKKGWAQELVMNAGYLLWTMPEYLQNLPPLRQPVTSGFHSMVAIPPKRPG